MFKFKSATGFIPILLDLLSNEYLLPSDEEVKHFLRVVQNKKQI